MSESRSLNLVPSAARTTTGNLVLTNLGEDISSAEVQLNCTAASGTSPTLNVIVEATVDGTNWYQLVAFTQRTAAGVEQKTITGIVSQSLRVSWTIAGTTPSFTFQVDAIVE